MFDFLSTILNDLHPIIVHFPIVLLTASFLLAFAARVWPQLQAIEWYTFLLGGLAALLAVITGLIAHFPYENSSLTPVIDQHQFPALLGTLILLGLLIWRAIARRKSKDFGQSNGYLAVALIGLIWIIVVGGTGGTLVYEYAVNVRSVNPLLP